MNMKRGVRISSEIVRNKTKGISSKLTLEELMNIYNNQEIVKKDKRMYRNVTKTIYTKEIDLNISPKLLAREKVYVNGQWVDTRPFIIKEGNSN